jgi:hypothetical protein
MSSTTWSTMGHSPTRKANGEWETLKNWISQPPTTRSWPQW